MMYQRKDSSVDAFRYYFDDEPKWFGEVYTKEAGWLTWNGLVFKKGWWILNCNGVFSCCDNDEFHLVYERTKG